jgi:hypothetical protein
MTLLLMTCNKLPLARSKGYQMANFNPKIPIFANFGQTEDVVIFYGNLVST